ncbi:hypothetical protein SAMN05421636_1211 [Pricia antarctica]|uniref:Uncharacterized protein n=1 Tax=Pricia antarctica TaxID=641691 RepID=A0A1G7JA69_9FLAO|nr:hypothetical protein [Pricia antarctica]SDF21862.1 hypothetical protein SAMN05421636_1211 [Pricia antarctica]
MIWKMNFQGKRAITISTLFLFLLSISNAKAQVTIKNFDSKVFDADQYFEFTTNKKIPKAIQSQALRALSFYSELKTSHIIFRFRKRITPLSSKPQVLSTFKKRKNRKYVITISTKSNKKLDPILFFNLPYNAQIGVLGHELAHISEYDTMNTAQLITLIFKLLNSKYTDQFEFNTDLIGINHGLGYQLYDWSQYVRSALDIPEWRGADDFYPSNDEEVTKQRYMNPQTIEKFMESNSIYHKK